MKHTLDVAGQFLSQLGALDLNMRATALRAPGLGADGSRPANGLGGRIEQLQHGLALTQTSVSKLQQRNAETQLVQASQEGSLQDTARTDIVLALNLTVNLIRDTGELERAQTAQVVDEQHELVARLASDESAVGVVVVKDLEEHGLDKLRQAGLDAVRARLVVNTHTHLNLITGDGVLGHGTTGNVNMFKGRADRSDVVVGMLSQFIDLLERATGIC